MTVTLTLPDALAQRVQTQAERLQKTFATFVIGLIEQEVDNFEMSSQNFPESIEAVVAQIKAMPKPKNTIHASIMPLHELLAINTVNDFLFDLAKWQSEWQPIEAMIKENDTKR